MSFCHKNKKKGLWYGISQYGDVVLEEKPHDNHLNFN